MDEEISDETEALRRTLRVLTAQWESILGDLQPGQAAEAESV